MQHRGSWSRFRRFRQACKTRIDNGALFGNFQREGDTVAREVIAVDAEADFAAGAVGHDQEDTETTGCFVA